MNRLIVAVALAATAGIAVAQSQPAQVPPPPGADMPLPPPPMDPLGGKSVNRAEFIADAGKRFDEMDSNRDGTLTADERREWHEQHRPRGPRGPGFGAPPQGITPPTDAANGAPRGRFGGGRRFGGGGGGMLERLDRDGDGKVSRAEYSAPFEMLDANHDGAIDASEMPQGGPGGGRMARLDRDGDGKLSRAEFEAPFTRLDANGDGFIDQSERDAVRARFGGQGPRQDEAVLQPQ